MIVKTTWKQSVNTIGRTRMVHHALLEEDDCEEDEDDCEEEDDCVDERVDMPEVRCGPTKNMGLFRNSQQERHIT